MSDSKTTPLWVVQQGEDFIVCQTEKEVEAVVEEWSEWFPQDGEVTVYETQKSYTVRRVVGLEREE
jgi:hypothetical protein